MAVETPTATVAEAPAAVTIEQAAPPAAAPTPSLMDEAPPAEGETPPVETPPVEGETPPAEEKPAEEAPAEPIEYTDFSAPEGVELDTEVLGELTELGKTHGWTQEQAQAIVDLGAKMQTKFQESFAESVVAARAEWREQTTTDAEFGGKNLQPNLAIARQARETFGTPALKELLDQSGLGDHPEVVRFFYKVGKATSEHDFVVSGKPSQPASFYDHPTSKK